ncbi:MAG: type II toxin-antitoxin system PemK/MazF family toxin [SAR324 cluster bacterium]|uniref:mRNA interferase n=1 Tax=SAR324 cluster bacterium TaxID=2024889 RepID=A0A7X9FQI9_9DELT|nr:type II toxin-antitoxin system PemK/MazF family toxin [SAR324 cluster bacterium]
MRIKRGFLYLADLSPRFGTEPGNIRPVLVIQTDKLNEIQHPSTWVLPCTTRTVGSNILRVSLPGAIAGNNFDLEVMIDQGRAIDNRRFAKELAPIPRPLMKEIETKLRLCAEL